MANIEQARIGLYICFGGITTRCRRIGTSPLNGQLTAHENLGEVQPTWNALVLYNYVWWSVLPRSWQSTIYASCRQRSDFAALAAERQWHIYQTMSLDVRRPTPSGEMRPNVVRLTEVGAGQPSVPRTPAARREQRRLDQQCQCLSEPKCKAHRRLRTPRRAQASMYQAGTVVEIGEDAGLSVLAKVHPAGKQTGYRHMPEIAVSNALGALTCPPLYRQHDGGPPTALVLT